MFHHRGHGGPGLHCAARFAFGPRSGFGRHHHGKHGGPWGGGPFGKGFGGPPKGRKFGRGDLKYVILDLLKDEPRHGYDIIKALEERSHGFYSPSPGSVYPTLQLLEDQGYISSTQQEGKRVYVITDEGRRFLTEQAGAMDDVRARMGSWGPMATPELRQVVDEVRQLGQFVFHQGARGGFGDAEKLSRLRDVVARARQEIEAIFTDGSNSTMV